jgi:hypothetical protein
VADGQGALFARHWRSGGARNLRTSGVSGGFWLRPGCPGRTSGAQPIPPKRFHPGLAHPDPLGLVGVIVREPPVRIGPERACLRQVIGCVLAADVDRGCAAPGRLSAFEKLGRKLRSIMIRAPAPLWKRRDRRRCPSDFPPGPATAAEFPPGRFSPDGCGKCLGAPISSRPRRFVRLCAPNHAPVEQTQVTSDGLLAMPTYIEMASWTRVPGFPPFAHRA